VHADDEIPRVFGALVTADHLIAQDIVDESILGDRTAPVVLDRGTQWLDMFPLLSKDFVDTAAALKEFVGIAVVQDFYSDCSPELKKVAEFNGWKHTTSTPGRPETNGVAERAVRTVIEGTRTALEHAGLPPKWWSYAGRHFCFALNVLKDGDTSPWRLRHKCGKFKGLLAPFGSLVDFRPSPTRTKPTAKFAPKSVPGIFLVYHVLPGGRWKGDYWVATLQSFQCVEAQHPEKVQIHRVKEVYLHVKEGYIFPLKPNYEKQRRTVGGDLEVPLAMAARRKGIGD